MKLSKKLIEKIEMGVSINDTELRDALVFYRDLMESVDCLGREFNQAKRPIRETFYRLEDFQRSRDQRKRKA